MHTLTISSDLKKELDIIKFINENKAVIKEVIKYGQVPGVVNTEQKFHSGKVIVNFKMDEEDKK